MFGPGGGRKHKPASAATGLFGMPAPSPIGSPPGAQQSAGGIGGFASPTATAFPPRGAAAQPSFGGFGTGAAANTTNTFGKQDTSATSTPFGSTPSSSTNPAPLGSFLGQQGKTAPGSLFSSTSLFNAPTTTSTSTVPAFGAPVFGQPSTEVKSEGAGVFGSSGASKSGEGSGLFGSSGKLGTSAFSESSNLFGSVGKQETGGFKLKGPGLFGATSKEEPSGPFESAGLFGSSKKPESSGSSEATGLFGSPKKQESGSIFGKPASPSSDMAKSKSLFTAPAPPLAFGSKEGTEKREPGSRPNSPTGQQSFSSGTVFGGPVGQPSATLFGGPVSKQADPEKGSLFGKPAQPVQQNLFGKPHAPAKESATAAFLRKVEEEDEGPTDFRPLSERFGDSRDNMEGPLPDLFPSAIEQDASDEQVTLPRASIKSRLGAVQPASAVEESVFGTETTVDESVFSKPKLSRPTPIFAEDEEQGGVSETESEVSSEGGTKKNRVERTVSREELASITSILCEAVPVVINKQDMLSKHFSKFGDVVNVVCNVKRKTATVTFTDHRGARKAKEKGKKIVSSLPPIRISYSQQSPRGDKVKSRVDKVVDKVADNKPRVVAEMTVVTNTVTGEGQQSEKQLLAIMQQPTHSDGDRWTVLEARDKYIRLRQPKSVTRSGLDIKDMNLIGTCPDFCPEKERYERSAKNRLEWYEKVDGGKLSHTSAVKEHSRSAADQGIPLPHELRPAPVLSRTMDYLMCNVLDRIDHMAGTMTDWFDFVEQLELQNLRPSDPMSQFYVDQAEAGESAADWFVFMWDRIRAVRKDISQQNLSDLTALSIVEKCARFHIICAERLCEESHHDFSPKLNDENLTKCLQTLQYIYYDLSLEGVPCPREYEFRAYDVLLNMNQGDTLRKVQTLGEHLRTHDRVKFAIKCFTALNSNNYVSFFNLVRKASFLEACILKRYFYQVRRRGVIVIQRAFTAGKGITQFPLDIVTSQLGFESEQECAKFLRVHGIESEDGVIFLERGTFVLPENEPPVSRAPLVIDSKRSVCYGEVMNGGPLPENPWLSYTPHCSFGDDGILLKEAWEAKDQEVVISPEELERSRLEEERRLEEKEAVKEVVEDLVEEEVCQALVEEVASDALYEAQADVAAEQLVEEMAEELTQVEVKTISAEVLREARNDLIKAKMEEERLKEEQEAACAEVVDDLVSQLVEGVAVEEMEVVEQRKKLHRYLAMAECVLGDVMGDTLAVLIEDTAAQVLTSLEEERELKVKGQMEKISRRRLLRCFKEWRRLASRGSRQRNAVLNFPPAPAAMTETEQNEKLGWRRERRPLTVADMARGKAELEKLYSMLDAEDGILQSAVLRPFPLVSWLRQDSKLFQEDWKLIFCLSQPGEEEDDARQFLQMLRMKLKHGVDKHQCAGLEEKVVVSAREEDGQVFRLAVREISTEDLEEVNTSESSRRELLGGASALLFLHLGEDLKSAVARLNTLLMHTPCRPPPPLLLLSPLSLEQAVQAFSLDQHSCKGVISSYEVISIESEIFNIGQIVRLTEGMVNLVIRRPGDPSAGLATKSCRDYVEDFLSKEVFAAWFGNLKSRQSLDLVDRCPDDLLHLYHGALDHLQEVVRDPQLWEVSWPATELVALGGEQFGLAPPQDWNCPSHVEQLAEVLEQLRLPEVQVLETGDWRGQVEQLQHLLGQVTPEGQDCTIATATLRSLLAKSYRSDIKRSKRSSSGGDPIVPPPELLPWTEILHCLVTQKLGLLAGRDGDEVVVFRENMLATWKAPDKWTAGLGWGAEHLERTVAEVVEETMLETREERGEEVMVIENKELAKALKREQKQSSRFEAMLEDALADRGPCKPFIAEDFHDENDEEGRVAEDSENEDLEEPARTEFVPVISYISPSLACLVSPLSLMRRQEVISTGKAPRHSSTPRRSSEFSPRSASSFSTPRSAPKRKADPVSEERATLPRVTLDHKLDNLRQSLRQDIEQDQQFEARLRAALQ